MENSNKIIDKNKNKNNDTYFDTKNNFTNENSKNYNHAMVKD